MTSKSSSAPESPPSDSSLSSIDSDSEFGTDPTLKCADVDGSRPNLIVAAVHVCSECHILKHELERLKEKFEKQSDELTQLDRQDLKRREEAVEMKMKHQCELDALRQQIRELQPDHDIDIDDQDDNEISSAQQHLYHHLRTHTAFDLSDTQRAIAFGKEYVSHLYDELSDETDYQTVSAVTQTIAKQIQNGQRCKEATRLGFWEQYTYFDTKYDWKYSMWKDFLIRLLKIAVPNVFLFADRKIRNNETSKKIPHIIMGQLDIDEMQRQLQDLFSTCLRSNKVDI